MTSIKAALLPEFDREMGITRRLLARVPDAELGWAPHARSRTLGQLAAHFPMTLALVSATFDQSAYDLAAGADPPRTPPSSVGDILTAWDAQVRTVREILVSRSDSELMTPFTLKREGREIFTMPKLGLIRTLVLNHLIHHRGQLSVYLRLRNVPVPSIYGPSADEGGF